MKASSSPAVNLSRFAGSQRFCPEFCFQFGSHHQSHTVSWLAESSLSLADRRIAACPTSRWGKPHTLREGSACKAKGKKAVQRLVSQTLFRAICGEEGTLAGDQELWVLALVFMAARRDKGGAVTEAGLGSSQPLRQESPRSPKTQKRILSSNLYESGWEEAQAWELVP